MQTRFVVLDFETANEDFASICQIGLAIFENQNYLDGWCALVNPEDYFSGMNIHIHGITEAQVAFEPKFPDVYDHLSSIISGNIVVSHTHFDQIALKQVCVKYGLAVPECKWLDSARVVRRCWPEQFSQSGYGLQNVAAFHGISYKAHNALEDARCAGEVLLKAIALSGVSPNDWLDRVRRPIDLEYSSHTSVHRDGNSEGSLYGEVLVFTGSLSEARQFAADRAAASGCRVDVSVTKHTTILVVGNQDIRVLAGRTKSSKHLKAEALIAKGQSLRIITERDFLELTSPHLQA
jgi:DNA polymerase-3 subunit epsilon